MSSISSIAFSSLQSATAQLQASTANIASSGSSGDLADMIVSQAAAQTNVSISLDMIRADAQAMQQLVDILV